MPGIRWVLVVLALACPALAGAGQVRLLLLPVVAHEGERALAERVLHHLEAEAARQPGLQQVASASPPACRSAERSCLLAQAVAAGADRVIQPSIRQVGEATVLLLVQLDLKTDRLERQSDPLPSGRALGPAVRERLVRLAAPEGWVGALAVEATAGSEIWLDGTLRGRAPLDGPLHGVRPGQHLLRVVRGQGEARAYVEIRYDRQTRVRIEPRSDEMEVLGFDPTVPEQQVAQEGGAFWRPLRWGLIGVGSAALLAAAWPALDARGIRADREALRDGQGAFPAGAREGQRALQRSYERRQRTSLVLLGSGAALLLGAGALFFFEPDAGTDGSVSVEAGPGGLSLTGAF